MDDFIYGGTGMSMKSCRRWVVLTYKMRCSGNIIPENPGNNPNTGVITRIPG